MTDLEVFHFLHVLGWALSKMIEMECLNCDEYIYLGGKKNKTKPFRTKPKTNNKTREICLDGDFVPSSHQSASFPMWYKLVE